MIDVQCEQQELLQENSSIQIVQEKLPLFGGVNSIRAVIGDSQIGILNGTSDNHQPLYIFTIFSQKIAKVEIRNRRGVVTNRTELVTQNIFLMSLDSIYEFEDVNNDSYFNYQRESNYFRRVDLSKVVFKVQKSREGTNNSDSQINYKIIFSGANISYQHHRGPYASSPLENLTFTFKLEVKRDEVLMPRIPTITIQPRGRELKISYYVHKLNVRAKRLIPRLKFSCNISGWDYSSSNSKLLLKTTTLTRELLLHSFDPITGISVTREMFKSTNLLGKLKFETSQTGKSNLDHQENKQTNYTNERFNNNRFSLGSSLRDFLNFTWKPTLSVDGVEKPIIYQPLSSKERSLPLNPVKPSINVPTLELTSCFIFPQGLNIHYDPEVLVEELNPLFTLLSIPNRLVLRNNSLIVLVSGFFVAIVIIIRQRSLKL